METAREIFKNAKWLWEEAQQPNRWMLFRKTFNIEYMPKKAVAYIAAETKYWLYVNDTLVVFEGGLNRGPAPGCGYFDEVDLTPYLKSGKNIIAVEAWYWGNAGRNNIDCGAGGFLFACEALGIYSDKTWKMLPQPAQAPVSKPYTLVLYGGHDIGYDAQKALPGWRGAEFDDSAWIAATERGAVPAEPWGDLYLRPIPLNRFSKILPYTEIKRHGNKYICLLPYAAHITPYFKVKAKAGQVLEIHTDRYTVRGGPGQGYDFFTFHYTEYTTKDGEQEFESLNWVFGEQVIYTIPKGVEVLELGYRESGYDADIIMDFTCSDRDMNLLVKKAARTMYVCMRDNFMDCPDRERGQWIGDLSVQAPQIFYCLDRRADLLCKKAVHDIINFRKGKRIVGLVPGIESNELPGQILGAVSSLGFVTEYFNYTNDVTVLEEVFEPFCDYLNLWEMDFDMGKIVTRLCDWYWLDHGEVIDNIILENCWYYLAVKNVENIAALLGKNVDKGLSDRAEAIKTHFDQNFWKGDGFRSGDFLDDRAAALAILCGFVKEDQQDAVLKVLQEVYYATPFMEYYVLEALFRVNQPAMAMERMRKRYRPLIENENSTLWEDFTLLGTKNHAWSGGPLTLLHKYGCGIKPLAPGFEKLGVLPYDLGIRNLNANIDTVAGQVGADVNISEHYFQMVAFAEKDIPIIMGIPKSWFGDKPVEILLNGKPVDKYMEFENHYAVEAVGRHNELVGRKF